MEAFDFIDYLNKNSGAITAVAAAATTWLTYSIHKSTRVQAQVATALKEIEANRDDADDPCIFVWFDGYNSLNGTGCIVMQNAGRKGLFLKSLQIESPGMDVQFFDLETNHEKKEGLTSGGRLNDLVITPEKIERFLFKFKNGSGQQFELIAQLYIGIPVRLSIDPSRLSGYELRAVRSKELFFTKISLG